MSIKNYGLVASLTELETFTERLLAATSIGFDLETGYPGDDKEKHALHPETAFIVGISFTSSTDWARYVPLNHDLGDNLDSYEVACWLWPLLQLGTGVAHNVGFELRHLAKFFRDYLSDHPEFGEQVRASHGYFPVKSCTQVEAYLSAEEERFGLKYLVKQLFGHQMTELMDLFPGLAKNRQKMLRFNTLEMSPANVEYACEDAAWCLAIHEKYYEQVSRMPLYPVEMAIAQEVLPPMEDYGVRYDWQFMARGADALLAFRDRFNAEIQTELSEMVGTTVAVNLASPPQLSDILFNKLGYRTTVYTATTRNLPQAERKMSTGKIALARLAKEHGVVKKIQQWKEMTRLVGTYLKKYEGLYQYAADGHTHPNHMASVVVTGRFAVSDPPYQQCMDGYQSVLTPEGWQRLDKIADGTQVAQYTNAGELEFVTPEVVRNPYHGDMIEFGSSEGGTWRFTPNHRMVYRLRKARGDRGLSDIKECTAEEWEARLLAQKPGPQGRRLHDRRFPKAGIRRGGRVLSETERRSLRLAVACQADGCLIGGRAYNVSIYIDRKISAFRGMGFTPTVRREDTTTPQGTVYRDRLRCRFTVPRASVAEWLDDSPEKNFQPEAILALCADDLRWFIDEIMQWDGDATRGRTYGQKNTRRLSVETVQAAAALCGYTTSIYERPEYDAVTVNISDFDHKEAGWQTVRRTPSDGTVYCVTVPTGMFLCRNDQGKVMVTGNSPKKYHFDLEPAKAVHRAHEDAHGPKCVCAEFPPPPGTCFIFNFRDAIIAPPDHYVLGFDLSQAELRAIAGMAQETALLRAFDAGVDVHSLTAALMLKIPVELITSEQRAIGKAQPVDELVLTPTGWRTLGELRTGDQVIARDGTPTTVTGVYPQGVRQVYRVGTVDGAEVRASDEHWWEIHPLGQNPKLMTTEELAKEPMRRGQQYRWFLPRIEAAQLRGGPHPIDPYLLGLLIGDGSFTTATPIFTSADQELVDSAAAALPIGCKLTTVTSPDRCPSYRVVHEPGHPNRLMTFLRHLGLAGKTAHHKFVPASYLYGDPPTRLAILQGLLDSDGSNNGSKGVEFVSASKQLCSDVQELIRSLGGRANMYYKPGVNAWRLWGRLPADKPPFRLTRKLVKMRPETGFVNRAIKYVEADGFAECVCISVDHPERLYITRGYVPTHNTMNFALLYGMGVKSLADRLALEVEEAQSLYDKYFAVYSNIAAWSQRQVHLGRTTGYVHSRFGRRLPIWEFQSEKDWIQMKGERACVNYPVQGSATGDYMKIAMVNATRAIKRAGLADKVRLVMNIHDALEWYVHRDLSPPDVIKILSPAVIFPVEGWPAMKADWHLGKKLGSPYKVEVLADGKISVKGEVTYELSPTIEIDEDTGEMIELLPDVDREALEPFIAPDRETDQPDVSRETEPSRDGRLVYLELQEMPESDSWGNFLDLLDQYPGPNTLALRTPEGDMELYLEFGTALTPDDTASVSMVLGMPARIHYAADDVDHAELVQGLVF